MAHSRISVGIEPAQGAVEDADTFATGGMARDAADFAVLPISRWHEDAGAVAERALQRGYFVPDDLVIQSSESSYCVLGKATPWTGGGGGAASHAEALAAKEFEYANYVGLRGVVAPAIAGEEEVADYARLLCALLATGTDMPVLVRVRLGTSGTWQRWNRVRLLCGHNSRLQVLLELDPADGSAASMRQWQAEPMRVVALPAGMFVPNASGYPVLRRQQQEAVVRWMDFGVALAVLQPDSSAEMGDHIRYLRHLAASRPERDPASAASDEYRDVLQAPLQPLMDHLESVTYETFELDAPKYEHYEEAIFRAITGVAAARAAGARSQLVLMVVGAGRGPLVSRALHAARRCEADVDVVALEKNPSAMVELQRKNAALWGGAVTLVHADMRRWVPGRRADILVSELLGSFGDNELSPECLDGALAQLAAADCVCIPRRYTAHVAPMSSAVLFQKAREYGDGHGLETPYVVNMHAAAVLADEKAAWSFCHDLPATAAESGQPDTLDTRNQRSCAAAFVAQDASLIHGIAGFFDAELYPGVELSIRPGTHTAGMHSWFPMYFPLKQPLTVAAGDDVVVRMWRRTTDARAWYEWCVEAGRDSSGIHNTNGRESAIGQ
ncbi:hypothetical protein LPJ61_001122 [Coemansia biformis]|uniref:Protein arginine N-methyltransferase n=1 Tax=Coemansia biformis TaxID=1286918 RepID=A0A9W7YH11_9FUNG|nr:hypothetical protein LPJ61_001122 [Coemansia biformis]